jgi:uncharacterized membrane protein
MILPAWASIALETADWTPFWNLRWLAYVVVVAVSGVLAWMINRERKQLAGSEASTMGILPLAISAIILWGTSVEIYSSFRVWQYPSIESWSVASFFAIASFWSLFAVLLLVLGMTWNQLEMRVMAYFTGGIGVSILLLSALVAGLRIIPYDAFPAVNLRFFAFLIVVAASIVGANLIQRKANELTVPEKRMASTMGFMAILLLLWGLTQETYATCYYYRAELGESWERSAQMGISVVWGIYGILLWFGGNWRNSQPVRFLALGLLGVMSAKLLLFDLSYLDIPRRAVAFTVAGIILVFIAWLYSRQGGKWRAEGGR